MLRRGGVQPVNHFLEEPFHAFTLERRSKTYRLVQHTTKTPDVGFVAVRLVHPHLGTSVVRRACLRVAKASLGDLRHVEIAKLGLAIFIQKNIGTFEISMHDFHAV